MKWYQYPLQIINIPLLLIILTRFKFDYDRANEYLNKIKSRPGKEFTNHRDVK